MKVKSGIYKITNKINDKVYIGLSINIKRRWKDHLLELKKNIHVNPYLQNAWNKHGSINFSFEVLEYCGVNELKDREIYYISKYGSFISRNKGYNLTMGGDGCMLGELNVNFNNEKYTFYHIDGLIERDITCYELYNKYRFDSAHIYDVVLGNRDISYGWGVDEALVKSKTIRKRYIFYHKDGRETIPLTQAEFNKQYSINNDSFVSELVRNKHHSCKGWYMSKADIIASMPVRKSLIHEDGRILDNITQIEFRKECGCGSCSSSQLFSGKYKKVKGWILK